MQLRTLLICFGALFGIMAMTAGAVEADDWFDCEYGIIKGLLPDDGIAGCTRIILSGTQTQENLSIAFANRCSHYKNKEEYDSALLDCNRAVKINRRSSYAIAKRGSVYHDKGLYDLAMADYNAAIALDPKNGVTFSNRALIWEVKENWRRALADHNNAVRFAPTDARMFAKRGRYYSGRDKYDLAFADLNRAIQLDNDHTLAYKWRGQVYYAQKNYSKAIADFSKAIELDSKVAGAYLDRAFTYSMLKKPDQEIDDYTSYIWENPDETFGYMLRGMAYKAQKKYDLAMGDFDSIVQLEPKETTGYTMRARLNLSLGKASLALPDIEKAFKIEPQGPYLYSLRGQAFEALGRKDEAIADHRKALALEPKIKSSQQALKRLGAALPKSVEGTTKLNISPSSTRKFKLYQNTDVNGLPLGTVGVNTVAECETACGKNASCQAYSFNTWNSLCFLKAAPTQSMLEPSIVSGVLGKLPPRSSAEIAVARYRGKAFPGKAFNTDTVDSFESCESRCQSKANCVAFSFVKAASTCKMFDKAGEYSGNAGVDSGVKRQATN